jgi:hypothetical protein
MRLEMAEHPDAKVESNCSVLCVTSGPLLIWSAKQTKQPVAHPYLLGYNGACLNSGRRLPMPRSLLDCATGLQGLVSTSESDSSPLATQEISAL